MTANPRPRAGSTAVGPPASAVGPVRAALLDHARAQGDGVVRRARQEADAVITRAQHEAQQLSARAAAEGEADAAAALATEQASTRRRARGVVLAAQASAYAMLREQVRQQVRALADDAQWPRRRTALERLAREALAPGGGAVVVEPLPDGVRATTGSRSITLTLADLADAAVDELGGEVERLWRT